ncbi:MAG: RagB/SusD family nutrient uptake outer membrane protein [Gemmatimonadota bacterium]|nr:RagB/SusD family nutrient uptake outer membrane protein [Gemmatimonadota bacterium]MDH5760334.1 RagB/SusD family nutrient uptake outer membrane protein [Gemmatimonadota bacterium]
MRNSIAVTALLGALTLGGCEVDLAIPDYNNPSLEELVSNPTPTLVNTAAQGLLIGTRSQMASRNGYVSLLGILGRESYNFDGSDPRFITEMLDGDLDPGSPAFGANLWNQRYQNIRNANILLNALDAVQGMSAQELEAIRGFAKTIQALDLLLVVNTRDANGAVIDTDRPVDADPAPIVSKDAAMDYIAGLLDEAEGNLAAGGSSFSFLLTSGFDGFDDPASFAQFNRALRARVAVYQGDWATALTALSESFIDTGASLDMGVYHVFGTGAGDTRNSLYDPGAGPDILAHPSIVADAELQPGGAVDERVGRKIRSVAGQTQQGVTTDVAFTIYGSSNTPIPYIRNEELILLRAEANIGAGNIAPAIVDINFIRENSGGLAPRAGLDATNILDELLTQKRYSLLFEGGHRWIDMRRYGKLGDLPLAVPSHQVNAMFPIPEAEQLARGG